MKELRTVFVFEKDTKNTRRYTERPESGAPAIGTLYLQKWCAEQLGGGELPERLRLVLTVEPVDVS